MEVRHPVGLVCCRNMHDTRFDPALPANHQRPDEGLEERRDANKTHFVEFGKAMARGFDDYFACYGKEQIHLWLLATHPDFRRRGVGTMLCNWGTEKAIEKGWVLTVLASPMGNKLYQELGYKLVGQFTIRADHEDESLEIYCLVKKTKESEQGNVIVDTPTL